MITVNTNGSAISAGFITALTADNTEYQARLLEGNTVLDCAISKLTITKGSCGNAEAFTIGNVVGSTLVAEVKGLATAVKGKEIKAQIGVKVNNAFEYVNLGYFVVSETQQTAYATTLTAYGATITRTGDAFTPPATQTLANVASAISTSASTLAGRTVTVTFGTGITTTDTITASLNNLTCYQALQVLASVVGGYAVDTYDGNINICRFDDTATLSRTTATMRNLPVVDEQNFEITGVLCVVTEASEDEEGTVIPAVQYPTTPTGTENLVVQNQYMTQALYTSYLYTLAGYEYRPATIGLTYGDPRLEGNDVLSVTDVNGSIYIVPCHLVTHKFDGGFTTDVVAVTATAQENDVATSAGNLTETLSGISQSAISARASAETAKAYAEEAKQTTDEINAYATLAGKTVTQILQDGETAGTMAHQASASAEQAQQSASTAYNYATVAVNQLGVVEDIVGVLDLVAKNGTYERTSDETAQPNKWYFTRSGTAPNYVYQVQPSPNFVYQLTADASVVAGKPYYTRSGSGTEQDPYVYTPVENPVDADIGTYYEYTNWYYFELTGIDSAIQNYVSSHLVLVGSSLFLQTDSGQGSTRLELNTTNGLILYDQTGAQVAQYGTKASIGNAGSFHITIDPANEEIGFWRGAENDVGNKVAYISKDTLYITRTVVLQEMKLGDTTYGTWAWRVHQTSSNQNNLYLKWLG